MANTFNHAQLRGAFAAGFSAAHGVEYPHGDPMRRKALVKIKTCPLIAECLSLEPRLAPLIEAAKQQSNEPGYNRIRRYYELKQRAYDLVGWECTNPALRTTKHFDAIVITIAELLPNDDVDLNREPTS